MLVPIALTGGEGDRHGTFSGRNMRAAQVEKAIRTAELFAGFAQPRLAPPQSRRSAIVTDNPPFRVADVHANGKALQHKAIVELQGQRPHDIGQTS